MNRHEARAFRNSLPGRWLLLHAGALGDLVLSIQLVASIEAVGNAGELHVLSRTDPGDLSGLTPSVRRESLESFSAQWLYVDTDAAAEPRLRDAVAGRCVVNCLGDANSMVHKQLGKLEPGRLFSFDPRPREGLGSHITGQWIDDLAQQGVRFSTPGRDGSSRSTAERCVLIHPGSGGADKCWPLPCFLKVGRRLREYGVAATFVIGSAEVDRWAKRDLVAILDEFRLVESPSPDELCVLLRAASVFLGNDAGPTHLAALFAVPTVAVFGPTSDSVWRPLGPRVEVFRGDPSSAPTDWSVPPQHVTMAVTGFLDYR